MDEMRRLWDEARTFGRVNLFTLEDGTYHACIGFNTIKHVSLEAKSSFKEKTPEAALLSAINKAKEVVGEISQMSQKFIGRKNP